ncbi:MAG: hypothetical protein F4227_04095 [Gammaproteobacteria bacterium]|nr:hypothetical protein [Gammaproteobacteria bacterium]MYF02160.1 hypothetical protein [Gammaproteobacteria bacterium]MYI77837.1 hypothetical protein [Gammaproteobacteria bacterium]
MLQRLRVRAQTTSAKIIFGLIAFVLVVFGFGAFNLFATFTPPGVAVVNGYNIPEAAFARALQNEKISLFQRYNGEIDLETIESMVNGRAVLERMIEHQLYVQKAADLGMVSSRQHYLETIYANPLFQVDGVFDQEAFITRVPRMLNYSLEAYEEELRKDHIVEALWNVQRLTSFYTEREMMDAARVGRQTRDIAYLLFDANSYVGDIEPAEEDVTTYYEEHSDEYMTDEAFELSFITISKADYTEGLEVSEEDISTAFEEEQRLAQENAERKSQHILIKVDATRTKEAAMELIQDIRQQIVDGASFGELAAEHSEDESNAIFGGDLDFAGRGRFVPEFEDVLFSLEIGELSEPVVTQFGVHLIKLNEIQEVDLASLGARFEEIRQEMLEDLATPEYDEAKRQLGIVADENSTLEPVAEAFGKEIQTQANVTRTIGEGVLDAFDVREQILGPDVLENGFNSRVIDVDERQAVVARLVSRTPPELKPLEDVRIQVLAVLRREEAARRAERDRDAAYKQLLETEDFNQVARDYGVDWITVDRLARQDREVPHPVRDEAFKVKVLDEGERVILDVDAVFNDKAILVVTGVHAGQWDELPQIDQQSIQTDLETSHENRDVRTFVRALRNNARIKNNLAPNP